MTPSNGEPDLAVVLPVDWWAIPLTDDDGRAGSRLGRRGRSAVDRVVARQFAGLDDQPLLRRETPDELVRVAQTAATAGGRVMAISLQQVQGMPLSAQLTTYLMDLGPAPGTSHLDDLVHGLLEGLRVPEGVRTHDRAQLPIGEVVRRVRVLDSDEEAPVPVLVADYWVERPDGRGLGQLTLSTGLLAWREPMLALFDAIAGTAHWR